MQVEELSHAELLEQLERFPLLVGAAFAALEPELARRQRGEDFAPVEHAWHLADLEQEGFGLRIRRLLEEQDPQLADFDGATAARERDYRNRSLDEGLARFASERAANLARLRALAPAEWRRAGHLEGVGPMCLADLPARMLAHDAAHAGEIRAWLRAQRLPDPWSA